LCVNVGYVQDRVCQTICLSWPWTMILLISASWVARIRGMSHQLLLTFFFFSAGDWTPGLVCARPVLCHWATPLAWQISFLPKGPIKKFQCNVTKRRQLPQARKVETVQW
jgi:hypothetical protein